MEFNPLPDLLNTGFTTKVVIGLFYGGEHLEANTMQIPDFFDKMAMFTYQTTTCENT